MSPDAVAAVCLVFVATIASAKPLNNEQPRTVDALSGGDILERNLLSRALSKALSSRAVDSLDGDLLLRRVPNDAAAAADLMFYLERLKDLNNGHLDERNLDTLNGMSFAGQQKKRLDTLNGMSFGTQKRNFDEIDKAGFGGFMKRNFDEIDRAGFRGLYKRNGAGSRAKAE